MCDHTALSSEGARRRQRFHSNAVYAYTSRDAHCPLRDFHPASPVTERSKLSLTQPSALQAAWRTSLPGDGSKSFYNSGSTDDGDAH